METFDLEGALWRLETKEQYQGERKAVYRLIDDIWKSGQIDEKRMSELMDKYTRFNEFMKS